MHHPSSPSRLRVLVSITLVVSPRPLRLRLIIFVRLLLQMLRKLKSHGRGSFIILSDLPDDDLPSLCFRASVGGLLSRVVEGNESEKMIYDLALLFSPREEEKVEECSCLVREIDTVTVCEDLVRDLDRFVVVMDEISNGGFLRGEESNLGSD